RNKVTWGGQRSGGGGWAGGGGKEERNMPPKKRRPPRRNSIIHLPRPRIKREFDGQGWYVPAALMLGFAATAARRCASSRSSNASNGLVRHRGNDEFCSEN